MRLLSVDSLDFKEFRDEDAPPYVAASHRWLDEGETTYQDARDRRDTGSAGYLKVGAFAKYIREELVPIKWLWIDTACINKESAAELSEAINSMFEWYHGAQLCLAYLADVSTGDDLSAMGESTWWKRGWTLQELLAPATVVFVTRKWHVIGYKGSSACGECRPLLGPSLEMTIAGVTGIPESVLHDYATSYNLIVDEKLKWMNGRETSRPEDMSYALFGILGVTLAVIYGEKYKSARERLLAAIRERDNAAAKEAEHYRSIADWLTPPDPWANHDSARQRHEPETGAWLLEHNNYLAWKSGSCRLLWLHGKAGCGKTVLCSTAIHDMQTHCQNATNIGHAIFYFSFSDTRKQTYRDLVVSLVVQLGKKEPGRSMLRQAYEESRQPGLNELQHILFASLASCDEAFLHFDGIDECLEGDDVRQNVLSGIEELSERIPNARMLVTSRDIPDVRFLMEKLGAEQLSITVETADPDIEKYVSAQLSRDHKLSRLDPATKDLIRQTLAQKADGMFRWVYCQLQMLKNCKSSRPSSVKAALRGLPKDLDETYERMVNRTFGDDRKYAIRLLRWLAYAESPLTLEQIAEAGIIDPTDYSTADGVADTEDRGSWEDTLELLEGLVIPQGAYEDNAGDMHPGPRINKDTKVRLAHFSVKEYLESSRMLASDAKEFHFDPSKEHRFITQSCLVYLMHYSDSFQKASTKEDLATFPLLEYAAKTWFYHARLQGPGNSDREVSFLTLENTKRDWLLVYDIHGGVYDIYGDRLTPFKRHVGEDIGTALYYTSLLGLETAARQVLEAGADVNEQGGKYGNALQAASCYQHMTVVQLLLDHQADINAHGGFHGTALQAASSQGHLEVVLLLLKHHADLNAVGGFHGTALQAASAEGHVEIVQLLLDHQADVNFQAGNHGSALQAASWSDHVDIVQLLLDHGADINAQGGKFGTALEEASSLGSIEIVQLLLDHQADVDVAGAEHNTALQSASSHGHMEIVRLLLYHRADVNATGGPYGSALQAAACKGKKEVVRLLLDHKADIHAREGRYGTALQGALEAGHTEIVQLLQNNGAH
ncbi:hypothetical protein LTR27_011656 [Elasticomyces elasticus]|nr:hypothetical protein LTR27_011656 [Elasticomyces elasticus]